MGDGDVWKGGCGRAYHGLEISLNRFGLDSVCGYKYLYVIMYNPLISKELLSTI
jgi:hypothetical protein